MRTPFSFLLCLENTLFLPRFVGLRLSYFIIHGSAKHPSHLLLRSTFTLQFIMTVWILLFISKQRGVSVTRKESVPTPLMPWVW